MQPPANAMSFSTSRSSDTNIVGVASHRHMEDEPAHVIAWKESFLVAFKQMDGELLRGDFDSHSSGTTAVALVKRVGIKCHICQVLNVSSNLFSCKVHPIFFISTKKGCISSCVYHVLTTIHFIFLKSYLRGILPFVDRNLDALYIINSHNCICDQLS